MVRGSVWWAELPEPGKSGPGFRRPVVVIQSDHFIIVMSELLLLC